MKSLLSEVFAHRAGEVLLVCVLFLSFLPTLEAKLVLGDMWRGVPVTYTDETLYQAQVQMVGQGNLTAGNPYLFEHRNDPPLVIFAGDWIGAIPQWLGLSFVTANFIDLLFWGSFFAIVLFALFRFFSISPLLSAIATLWVYLESFAWVQRVSNMQPFLGFFVLFYLSLARFLKEQNNNTVLWLGMSLGSMFYFYAFLWQAFVITLGLVFLYSFFRKNWHLLAHVFYAGLLGVTIGAPVPLYIYWISHTKPLFWESVSRYGLVSTHIPMAEVFYSGGFIGLVLLFLWLLQYRHKELSIDPKVIYILEFIALSGLGLWVMEGSNLFTGKLLETAEHIKLFIYKFYIIDAALLSSFLHTYKSKLSKVVKCMGWVLVSLLLSMSLYYTYLYFYVTFISVLSNPQSMQDWRDEQAYAGPITWLNEHEHEPVVVWTDPDEYISWYFAVLSSHYVLFATPAIWHLTSDEEIRERYLVAEYFNSPSEDFLKKDIAVYMGRNIVFHQAKTIERKVKICRVIFFLDRSYDCGTIPTPLDVIGDNTFSGLEQKSNQEIRPHITEYLKKYHVRYVLKDKKLHSNYEPLKLRGLLVYSDARYELYRLP